MDLRLRWKIVTVPMFKSLLKLVAVVAVGAWIVVRFYPSDRLTTGKAGLTTSIDPDLSAEDRSLAQSTLKDFVDICGIDKIAPDIERIDVTLQGAGIRNGPQSDDEYCSYNYRCEQYGWHREVVITLKVHDETSVIPASYYAGGYTLTYFVGGGHSPGIVTQEDPGKLICGMVPGSSDGFLPAAISSGI